MKKLLALLAFVCWPALAQISTAPVLLGQRGLTDPANCQDGQLFYNTTSFLTKVCHPANTWTTLGGGGSATDITVGTTTVTGGTDTYVLYNNAGVLGNASTLRINGTAGQGPSIVGGTATTNVAAFELTRTNNNAAVATGVKFTFTDTSSAAGFLPLQVLGGVAGTTNLLSVSKGGLLSASGGLDLNGGGFTISSGNAVSNAGWYGMQAGNDGVIALTMGSNHRVTWASGTASATGTGADTGLSRVGVGILGVGTSAAQSVAGTIAATNYRVASTPLIFGASPTVASGGCTTPGAVSGNGTAAFSLASVGTSCSGSQPLVFTLSAASTGWLCWARNVSNGGTSAPRQTGAVSTTSVTITNFAATTGLAAAWTDADVVVVGCHAY